MQEFLESIENSGFATYIRETPSVLGYSTILALHTFGMAFLVGLSGVIALRVLGIVPELPLKPLKSLLPIVIVGFWLNAVTGVVLTTLASPIAPGELGLLRQARRDRGGHCLASEDAPLRVRRRRGAG